MEALEAAVMGLVLLLEELERQGKEIMVALVVKINRFITAVAGVALALLEAMAP